MLLKSKKYSQNSFLFAIFFTFFLLLTKYSFAAPSCNMPDPSINEILFLRLTESCPSKTKPNLNMSTLKKYQCDNSCTKGETPDTLKNRMRFDCDGTSIVQEDGLDMVLIQQKQNDKLVFGDSPGDLLYSLYNDMPYEAFWNNNFICPSGLVKSSYLKLKDKYTIIPQRTLGQDLCASYCSSKYPNSIPEEATSSTDLTIKCKCNKTKQVNFCASVHEDIIDGKCSQNFRIIQEFIFEKKESINFTNNNFHAINCSDFCKEKNSDYLSQFDSQNKKCNCFVKLKFEGCIPDPDILCTKDEEYMKNNTIIATMLEKPETIYDTGKSIDDPAFSTIPEEKCATECAKKYPNFISKYVAKTSSNPTQCECYSGINNNVCSKQKTACDVITTTSNYTKPNNTLYLDIDECSTTCKTKSTELFYNAKLSDDRITCYCSYVKDMLEKNLPERKMSENNVFNVVKFNPTLPSVESASECASLCKTKNASYLSQFIADKKTCNCLEFFANVDFCVAKKPSCCQCLSTFECYGFNQTNCPNTIDAGSFVIPGNDITSQITYDSLVSGSTKVSTFQTPEIYKIAETNVIGASICRGLKMMELLLIPIAAIMFTVMGFSAFQGELKWSIFLTFAIGIAIFKGAGSVLEIFIPGTGISFGCKCATYRRMKYTINGVMQYVNVPTGLTEDCEKITPTTVATN